MDNIVNHTEGCAFSIIISEKLRSGNLLGKPSLGNFCNGIVFSSLPLGVHQKICLELATTSLWSGALRLGVTAVDPARWKPQDLPRYVCPDLTNRNGYWARALKENYASNGARVTFYINAQSQLHYFINNEHKGVLLHNLPTGRPLWALLDIYGNTLAASFVQAGQYNSNFAIQMYLCISSLTSTNVQEILRLI